METIDNPLLNDDVIDEEWYKSFPFLFCPCFKDYTKV
jgi:hypothetical protein